MPDTMSKLTQLIEAARTNDDRTVAGLVKEGVDPAKETLNGNTAVREAVLNSSKDVIQLLLGNHIGVDFKTFYMPPKGSNELGYCPIHYAQNEEVIDLLLELGANIDQQTHMGHTLLMLAIAKAEKEDSTKIVTHILSKSPNLKKRGKFDFFAKNGSAQDLTDHLISRNERMYAKRKLDSVKQVVDRLYDIRSKLQ
ncbi:ankyrin repeat domain-containing protein [Motiliproteus sp. SC1-56]|uniref:ankyrin repeat domain-containing protein n=1 Tax=Motiliproteus sp. SC1-56 TaxID=2799565 RepID=UPI001A8F68C0|nr:ankyrin repeat domain-containing protein [Motiliproteus sp. SC1-56]